MYREYICSTSIVVYMVDAPLFGQVQAPGIANILSILLSVETCIDLRISAGICNQVCVVSQSVAWGS